MASLWLEVPDLQPAVAALAADVGNPVFVPHLTLVGQLPWDADDERLDAAVRHPSPSATLRLSSYGTQHEGSRFLCLVADAGAELRAVFARLHDVMPGARAEHFAGWPHVSLLYGTPPAQRRWPDPLHARDRFGGALLGEHRAVAVSVWDTAGDVGSWRRLRTWPVPAA